MDSTMETVEEAWKLDPKYHRAADYLGLNIYDRQNYKTAQKISVIHDYAARKGQDMNTVLTEMHKLKRSLGTFKRGEDLVDELYQSVRLKTIHRE